MFVLSLRRFIYFFELKQFNKTCEFHNFIKKRTLCLYQKQQQQQQSNKSTTNEITIYDNFENIENKNRNTYLEMIKIFVNRDPIYRRGQVEFIYSALKHMEEFGVHKDLKVYKSLIDILPKDKYVATNMFQIEFMHYPKQQQCVIDLLEQMEDNGVMPDYEIEELLTNIFGKYCFPLRKFWRMMYWMPKFKNLTPWPIPDPLPNDIFEIAKIAIERISSVDVQSNISVYQTKNIENALEDTWIISAQSPTQQTLLNKHDGPVYVKGPFKVWIKRNPINYFILQTNNDTNKNVDVANLDDVSNIDVSFFGYKSPKHLIPVPSVHEQDDGIILALCATGTSSKDSLLSWIRHLEKDGNAALTNLQIVFTLKSSPTEILTVDNVKNDDTKHLIK